MSSIDGAYECVTKSPMGDQKSTFTIKTDGNSFTGSNAGMMGSMDIEDGVVNGNTITWKMKMTVPMPLTLTCEATIDGDTLTGSVDTGAFGKLAMNGTRKA
ncbi:MAG: hypothetical protein MUF41_02365 [Sphingopyxis sp.]|jgi:hypothetical protein|nr:hypothetical protein [Sphingopyxis sp.]